ncbi:MAG: hypothetical protein WC145_12835 [Aliarcobacter sp.]
MSTEKTVTWSGTVSLPDGDTIGLVVSGPATTPEEGLDIAAYAAGQLIGLSRLSDDDTGARIRRYVAATFGVRAEDLPGAPVETLPIPVEGDEARQQHAAKLKGQLDQLQADHDARVAQRQAAAQPAPTADDLASAITAEKQDAAAAQAEEVLAIESRVAGATERPHPDAKPEQAKAPAPQPAPSAPPTPEASTVATAPDAPQSAPTAPPKMGSGAVCEKCGAEVSDAQKNLSQLFTNKTLCKTCLEAP